MVARQWLGSLLVLPLGAAFVLGQEKKPVLPADPAVMARMRLWATPGAAHEVLDGKVGEWKAEVRWFLTPGAEPVVSRGTAVIEWIMGGRFLEERLEGNSMGQAYEGRGISGYDTFKQQYFTTWFDSFGTGLMPSTGTFDPAARTFTLLGEFPDCRTGRYERSRTLERHTDDDHWSVQIYLTGAEGQEHLETEILYTRMQ